MKKKIERTEELISFGFVILYWNNMHGMVYGVCIECALRHSIYIWHLCSFSHSSLLLCAHSSSAVSISALKWDDIKLLYRFGISWSLIFDSRQFGCCMCEPARSYDRKRERAYTYILTKLLRVHSACHLFIIRRDYYYYSFHKFSRVRWNDTDIP